MRPCMLLILFVSFTVSVFAQQDTQPKETPNRLFRRTLFPRQQDDPQRPDLHPAGGPLVRRDRAAGADPHLPGEAAPGRPDAGGSAQGGA